MENGFKLCPNGHYYQGDECPYCKEQNLSAEVPLLDDITPPQQDWCICPNGHGYSQSQSHCPYCGETEIVKKVVCPTMLIYHVSMELPYGRTSIQIDDYPKQELRVLTIAFSPYGGRSNYSICISSIDYPIRFNSIIRMGKSQITGKKFIEWIDRLIDHIYDCKLGIF